jgi:hypothetical protein
MEILIKLVLIALVLFLVIPLLLAVLNFVGAGIVLAFIAFIAYWVLKWPR